MQVAAIYARVSSDRQREENTIASQTAALIDFASSRGYRVPKQWIFEDDGYSGASLVRPGLERLRDLAAEGQLQAVLVHAPDRLSRKYAYQVLLVEELARHGVETVFVKAPQAATPEDRLLLQFQGMIAEYERAQILERSRRGKRHRALQGEVSVLGAAPYGYRYVRRSLDAAASYQLLDAEADVVRMIYERYTVHGLSIRAITRWLNQRGVPTRRQCACWQPSTVWAMLRNPAYKGTACFGKTEVAPRQRITRPLRRRGAVASRHTPLHERPREAWIEIAVPVIISEQTFARAHELLQQNKALAARRTLEPSLGQGLVSCSKCGYALSRVSRRTTARKLYYYRCIGSDAWRYPAGRVCNSRPVRQDLLDQLIWTEVIRLLSDPSLIQDELDRRLAAARTAEPTTQRQTALQRDLARTRKAIERLLAAYQEDLLSLDELRQRMPTLRQREHAIRAESQAIVDQVRDRTAQLRLAQTLASFLTRLHHSAQTLDVHERQRIVRLLVKEILVGDDTIVIRHSIPIRPNLPPTSTSEPTTGKSYLLCSQRHVGSPPPLRAPPQLRWEEDVAAGTFVHILAAPSAHPAAGRHETGHGEKKSRQGAATAGRRHHGKPIRLEHDAACRRHPGGAGRAVRDAHHLGPPHATADDGVRDDGPGTRPAGDRGRGGRGGAPAGHDGVDDALAGAGRAGREPGAQGHGQPDEHRADAGRHTRRHPGDRQGRCHQCRPAGSQHRRPVGREDHGGRRGVARAPDARRRRPPGE